MLFVFQLFVVDAMLPYFVTNIVFMRFTFVAWRIITEKLIVNFMFDGKDSNLVHHKNALPDWAIFLKLLDSSDDIYIFFRRLEFY